MVTARTAIVLSLVAPVAAALVASAGCSGSSSQAGVESMSADGGDDSAVAQQECDQPAATWSSLYRCFIGVPHSGGPYGPSRPAEPGCSGTAYCHSHATDMGATASQFLCGETKDTCYQGFTSPTAALVNPKDPASSDILRALRHVENGKTVGDVPVLGADAGVPNYVFSPAAMAAFKTWISAGAPNN